MMNNYVLVDTPMTHYATQYPHFQTPFPKGKDIFTQLPKNVAIIRAVAAMAFTPLLALKLSATVFCWPVAIAGIAFSGWTLYSHLLSADPLMETFYTIMGGKDQFEALPQINLTQAPGETLSEAIRRIFWDNLNDRIAITKTLDGRNVIIIKGYVPFVSGGVKPIEKHVLAFVEKTCPGDVKDIAPLAELADSIMHAIFMPLKGNTFGKGLYFGIQANGFKHYGKIYSSISGDMANELFNQLSQNQLNMNPLNNPQP